MELDTNELNSKTRILLEICDKNESTLFWCSEFINYKL